MINERLYRKDLVKKHDKMVKDLTKLNQDLSRVLLVDNRSDICLQTENQINIPHYNGRQDDNSLKGLADFFKDRISEIEHNIDLRSIARNFQTN